MLEEKVSGNHLVSDVAPFHRVAAVAMGGRYLRLERRDILGGRARLPA